jgi:uncharacterized LabA/DUF88 family protein
MKTIIYIDHFNFYYPLLRASEHKWLDYYKLFIEEVIPELGQPCESIYINLFSSDIKANFHKEGQKATHAQSKYFRALKFHIGEERLKIHKGKYHTNPMEAYPYCESSPKKPKTFEKQRVWKIEEKLTDVALSVNAYRDAAKNNCEQIIICSNDSDISPSLKLIKEDFPHIKIGVVYPQKKEGAEGRLSKALDAYCDWSIAGISNEALKRCQMPNRVRTDKKPIDKPAHW